MAEILAKEVLISVNMGTDSVPDWNILGCSESDGLSASTDTITISNKCEGSFAKNLPGDQSWSLSNTMVIPKVPQAGFVSYDQIFELWKNDQYDADGELRQWKIESIDNTDFDYYSIVLVYISYLCEQFDSVYVFITDVTITLSGEFFNIPTT